MMRSLLIVCCIFYYCSFSTTLLAQDATTVWNMIPAPFGVKLADRTQYYNNEKCKNTYGYRHCELIPPTPAIQFDRYYINRDNVGTIWKITAKKDFAEDEYYEYKNLQRI